MTEATLAYTTSAQLFASGTEAAAHGRQTPPPPEGQA